MNYVHRSTFAGGATRTLREPIIFGFVGILNTVVDFVTFLILTRVFHWDVVVAQIVAYICGLTNSYLFNRWLTFRDAIRPGFPEVIRFLLVNTVSCVVSIGMLVGLQRDIHSIIAIKLVVTGVTLAINFVGSKWWVFRAPQRS